MIFFIIQILGSLGCQGWVVTRNAQKIKNKNVNIPALKCSLLPRATSFNHMHCFLGLLEKIAYTLQKSDCSTSRHRVSA